MSMSSPTDSGPIVIDVEPVSSPWVPRKKSRNNEQAKQPEQTKEMLPESIDPRRPLQNMSEADKIFFAVQWP